MPKLPANIKAMLGLSVQLSIGQFKTRNEGSYLGIFWYLLNPILTFFILYLIFADRLGNNISHYPLYLFFGIILFNVFQATTVEATRSVLREYHYLIKSINFPRESLILSIVIRNIYSHFFELLLFIVLLLYFGVSGIGILYYIPVFILFFMFLYGAALLFSSIAVYFADLDNIWSFAIKIIWFGTPIFYAIESQTRLYYLNLANPMYYFITLGRELVIYSRMPSATILIGTFAFSILTFVAGLTIFRKLKPNFAEMI